MALCGLLCKDNKQFSQQIAVARISFGAACFQLIEISAVLLPFLLHYNQHEIVSPV